MASLEHLTNLVGALIIAHRELTEFASRLSSPALVEELRGAIQCLENGLPLVPPRSLQEKAAETLSPVEWTELLGCVGACANGSGGPMGADLSGPELEAVAIGILWSCLLIEEYGNRNQREALEGPTPELVS